MAAVYPARMVEVRTAALATKCCCERVTGHIEGTRTIDGEERLQRVLASRGVASRRQAEAMIRAGRVTVDGLVVTQLGTKVNPRTVRISVDGRPLRRQAIRYLLLNKPRGYITTTSDERDRQTVMDLVQVRERLFPVGRLDRDTEGLILLTNDGELANRVMHPRYRLPKEYTILTADRPSEFAMNEVRRGIAIEGRTVVPEEFRILRELREGVLLTITIHEGLNRVVRRLMEMVDIPVVRLRRVRVGPIDLGSVAVGTYRDLSPGELLSLRQAVGLDVAGDREIPKASPSPRTRAGAPKKRSGSPAANRTRPDRDHG